MDKDLIFGLHSIYHCLKNPKRTYKKLVGTNEGFLEFKKKYSDGHKYIEKCEIEKIDSHQLQERAKKICAELDVHYQRVPSQLYLLTSEKEIHDPCWLYDGVIAGDIKRIICLDQVTDVHNAAAIVRTAAFYNVKALLFSNKGSFGNSPSFNRIASGGNEYISFIRCKSLPKVLTKLQDMGVHCLGFSEHAKGSTEGQYGPPASCLIFGAEETGMSHAVQRVLQNTVAIDPQGPISSLNVSVAAAVAMEKYFSN
jgi:23S rRNA (guanosine2251-2'-O)-methyltransferase